jgi:hypothetical protein
VRDEHGDEDYDTLMYHRWQREIERGSAFLCRAILVLAVNKMTGIGLFQARPIQKARLPDLDLVIWRSFRDKSLDLAIFLLVEQQLSRVQQFEDSKH